MKKKKYTLDLIAGAFTAQFETTPLRYRGTEPNQPHGQIDNSTKPGSGNCGCGSGGNVDTQIPG